MKHIIFFSWQSDSPNKTNRGFIGDTLERVIGKLSRSDDIEVEASLDRDTQGVPGAPAIAQTIMDKIRDCDVFVADITIIARGTGEKKRACPNPNVLLELGFAVGIHSWDRVILLFNEAFGNDDDIPFDLRQHRRINYRLNEIDDKSDAKKQLTNQLAAAIALITQSGKSLRGKRTALLQPGWGEMQDDKDFTAKPIQTVVLKRCVNHTTVESEVLRDMAMLDTISGDSDPNWESKCTSFRDDARKFVGEIQTRDGLANYMYGLEPNHARFVALMLSNTGNVAAQDIRITIQIPDWLCVLCRAPRQTDIPVQPIRPTPRPANRSRGVSINDLEDSIRRVTKMQSPWSDSYDLHIHRDSNCYVRGEVLHFWAESLRHRSSFNSGVDRVFLMALATAPIGPIALDGKLICDEYLDWEPFQLTVTVVE